jgi:hypothetical protein
MRAAVAPLHLVHVGLVAVFFEAGGWYLLATGGFAVAAGVVLNEMYADDNQKPAAAVMLVMGFAAQVFLVTPPASLPWFGYMLLLKLIVGFALDHYPPRDQRVWWS